MNSFKAMKLVTIKERKDGVGRMLDEYSVTMNVMKLDTIRGRSIRTALNDRRTNWIRSEDDVRRTFVCRSWGPERVLFCFENRVRVRVK